MRRRLVLVRVVTVLTLGAGQGCLLHPKVRKAPYQVALEAYSAATTREGLEAALRAVNDALARDPADAQLRLLRASVMLRKVRQERLARATWQADGPASLLMEDLRRATALLAEAASGPAWIAARAYIITADLALLRAQTDTSAASLAREPAQKPLSPLAAELQARALRQLARELYICAFRMAETALKGAQPPQAALLSAQRNYALEGLLAAEAHLAVSETNLDLTTGQRAALVKVREAVLEGRLPDGAAGSVAPLSLEPLVYDRDWRVLRAMRPETQREWLRWRELAFRQQVAASFLEDPGRARLFSEDLLEDLASSLAATRLRWRLIAAPSAEQLRIRVERHAWFKDYTAPILDFALYVADRKALEVSTLEHRAAIEGQARGPVFVGPDGVTLVLHPGEAPEAPAAGADVHLYLAAGDRFEFLDQKGARLRVVDGFGRTVASVLLP